jgi:hypothetical protein
MTRKFLLNSVRLIALNVVFAVALAGAVRALPLIGDQTIILLTADDLLVDAGVLTDALGDAVIGFDLADRLEALFPITGGDVDGLSGTIEHDDSGLLFSDGVVELALENFLIDLDSLTLFGDVTLDGVPGGNLALMDVGFCTDLAGTAGACIDGDGSELLDGFKLSLTKEGANALSDAFGLPDLTGTQFGVARIDIRAVPEPSTALLVGAGLLAAAGGRRRAKGR